MAGGRPRKLTDKMKEEILVRIADGETIRSICRSSDHLPDRATVYRAIALDDEFRDRYTIAKDAQLQSLEDELLEIADDASNDWMEKHDADGNAVGWQVNGDHIRRSLARIDVRKWVMAKRAPKKYGEKTEQTVKGDPEAPVQTELTYRYVVVKPEPQP